MKAIDRMVLASGNAKKIRELQQLLSPAGIELVSQKDLGVSDAVEDGLSFIENALIKARHACRATGLPALADDSGLEVFALDGKPGIHSARFAGEQASDVQNNQRLLQELTDIEDRRARFVCVLVFMRHATDPTPLICQGFWEGEILTAPRGEQGFGYDPLFMLPDRQCTSAELDAATKNRISHRGQAMQQLQQQLLPLLAR